MRETSRRHTAKDKSIGFVPTMGALHDGHLSLIRRAKDENDIVAASVFVNPIQFGADEDFDRYPRDIEGDREKLEKSGADVLFIPEAKMIYTDGFSTHVHVDALSDKLCGAFRPGHFDGVATVVCKLFNIVRPTRAYFGQKDFQQTVVIRRITEDLNIGVDIVVCPTVREYDGLAMSSRNAYLSPEERKSAGAIYRALQAAAAILKSGSGTVSESVSAMKSVLSAEPLISEIQYSGIYDPLTLAEAVDAGKEKLIAAAVKIGRTRLIDNILV